MNEIVICTEGVNAAEVIRNYQARNYGETAITEVCTSNLALAAALARIECCRSESREAFFTVKAVGGAQMRPFSDIMYATSDGHRFHVHLADGAVLTSSNTRCCFAQSMAPLLLDRRFVQCSRSIVVNTAYICGVNKDSVELYGGEALPLPAHRQLEFRRLLGANAR